MSLFDPTYECEDDTIKLSDLVPEFYFDDEDDTTDKFIDTFDGVFCQLLKDIENLGKIIEVDVTDERFLDMLIRNLGFTLNVSLSVDRKRKLVKVIINAYKQKGTCLGIENVIRQFLGIDATCFPFTQGWILDQSELSHDTYLNPAPNNPAGFYTFDVIVQTVLSAEQRRIIIELVNLMKPAHTHFRELIEEGIDSFILAMTAMLNRGSLWLANNQNTDGGWDANEADGDDSNASDIANVSYHALGCLFAYNFNSELETSYLAFQAGGSKLINDATYSFESYRPKESDILMLNRAEIAGVAGALAKRDEAILALNEFTKAIAYLNNYSATPAQIAATTQPERDSTTQRKRAKFLYLYLTNAYGLAEGTFRFVRYIRDYIEIADLTNAEEMSAELNLRTGGINFVDGYGAGKVLALSSIIYGLQLNNVGAIYEDRISSAETELDTLWMATERQYFSTVIGTGKLIEQSMVIDALMERGRYNRTRSLLIGIKETQEVTGTIDDYITPGSKRLRDLGAVMDSSGRAVKRIQDEGL